MVIKLKTRWDEMSPNWSETWFYFSLLYWSFCCQCRVPKTHSFIPLIIALYSIQAEKWCFRKGSEYYVFVKAGSHYIIIIIIIINFVSVWCLFISRWFWPKRVDSKSVLKKKQTTYFCTILFDEERRTRYFPLGGSGLIATLHTLSFCRYLCYILLACLGMPCS